MKFEITLNDDDFIAYNIADLKSKRLQCIAINIWAWATLIWFSIAVLSNIINQQFGFSTVIWLAMIVWIVLYFLNYPKSFVKRQVSKLKKQGKLPYPEKSTVEFFADEFCETTDNSMEKAKYDDITKILQDKEHIHLKIGAMKGCILPIRCLNGQEQALLDFINDKLSLKNPYAPPKSAV